MLYRNRKEDGDSLTNSYLAGFMRQEILGALSFCGERLV
jgi:hypothetical protein